VRVHGHAADRYPLALVNSVNPYRIEGQTTAAFEICEALGDAPDVLALPVGNGGNITAYHLGFQRCADSRRATREPSLIGAQAAGAAPLVLGHPVDHPETVATAIRVGRPATWEPAIAAARDSGGRILAVSDAAILEAWRSVARLEGIFCEPASAAGIAALRETAHDGGIRKGARCVLRPHRQWSQGPGNGAGPGIRAGHDRAVGGRARSSAAAGQIRRPTATTWQALPARTNVCQTAWAYRNRPLW